MAKDLNKMQTLHCKMATALRKVNFFRGCSPKKR